MKIKQILRFIIYRFPLNQPVFYVLRKIFIPSESLRNHLRFIGKFKVKTADGKQFYLHNNAFKLESDFFWLGFEKVDWEPRTRKIWEELCKSSSTILDIGANTGIFSVLAKVYNPKAKVFSFEPQPNIFSVLKKSVEVNNFDTQCENIALSNQNGQMKFYNYGPLAFEGNTTAGSLNMNFRPDDQKSIVVEVRQLSDYITEKKIAQIDLIKIDVETHEYEVLLGYGPSLLQHEPVFIIELQNETIGKNIETLVTPDRYLYYSIDEKKGLVQIQKLGIEKDNHNYLLCPKSKLKKIENILS